MNKLKIRGLGDLVLVGDIPKSDIDYIVSLRACLKKIEKDVQDTENPAYTYILQYQSTENIMEFGAKKKLIVENGRTDSQKLRWSLEKLGEKKGLDPKDYYHQEMNKFIYQVLKELND